MVRGLTLFPSPQAAAQALAEADGGMQLPGDLSRSFHQFALEIAAGHRPLRLPTPTERLTLALQAADAAGLTLPEAALGAFARSLSEMHGSGLTAAQLQALGPRAERLARAFEKHQRALAEAGLCDIAGVAAAAAEAVRGGAIDGRFDKVVIEPRGQWSQADLELVAALAKRVPVEAKLADDRSRPALFSPLDAAHQELSSAEGIEVLLVEPMGSAFAAATPALQAAIGGLFGTPSPSSAVEVRSYGSEADEARGVALGVRALLRAGVAPDAIAVTALGALPRPVPGALALAGIPVAATPAPLTAARAAQVVLAFAAAAAEGIPREPLCELLELEVLEVPNGRRWAQLLREAGSGDHRSGRLLAPLSALLARKAARQEAGQKPEGGREPFDGLPQLTQVVAALAALPEQAPIAQHAALLWAALAATGALRRLAKRPEQPLRRATETRQLGLFGDTPGAGSDGDAWEMPWVEVAAQEATMHLEQLEEVLGALQASGSRRPRSLLEFAVLLKAAFDDTPRWQVAALPGGVAVLPYEALAGRSFAHVFVVGLSGDGGGGAEDSFLPESLREAARDSQSRPAIFARTGAAAARARERLAMVSAAALARTSVRASGARSAEGHALPPSPLLIEMGRAAIAGCQEEPLQPWPALGERALTREEVAAAIAVEPAAAVVAAEEPLRSARHAALRAQRVGRERAIVERRPGPYSGDLQAPDLRELLAAPLVFGEARPLSATTLEWIAGCGFRAFAQTVLRLRAPDERDEALDSRDRGTLSHACLEAGFRALREQGLLPLRGRAAGERRRQEIAVFQAAITGELDQAEHAGQAGHPSLWQAHRRHTERELLAVLAAEQQREDPLVPSDFELGFGPGPEADRASPTLVLEDGPILLGGFVDRVDRAASASGAKLRVVDYKSGRIEHRQRRLMAEFADRDLQLGHYALAFSLAEPGVDVDAVYYSIRDAEYSKSLGEACLAAGVTIADFLETRAERRAVARQEGRPNLANRIEDALRETRAGRFPIAPGDCSYCDFRAACRVGRLYEEWE